VTSSGPGRGEEALHGDGVEIEHLRASELCVSYLVEAEHLTVEALPARLTACWCQCTTTSFSVAATTHGSMRRSAPVGCNGSHTSDQLGPGRSLQRLKG